MKVPRDQIAQVIAERTLAIKQPKQLARVIAAYLLDEHLTFELESLLRDIIQYRVDHGVVEATVTSARELSPTVLSEIRTLLKLTYPSAKKISLEPEIDPEVIGAVRVTLPNEQFDDTVRSQLNRFKQLIKADG